VRTVTVSGTADERAARDGVHKTLPDSDRRAGWLGRAVVALAVGCLLGACGGPSLDPVAPSGFNLEGQWELVRDASGAAPDARQFKPNRTGARRELARGGVARDFPVLSSSSMRIEQNPDSMGVSYASGDYRDITWGVRERGMWKINAGWVNDELHIISKAHDSQATEIMRLSPDGNTLTVSIEVNAGEKFAVDRVFRRTGSVR